MLVTRACVGEVIGLDKSNWIGVDHMIAKLKCWRRIAHNRFRIGYITWIHQPPETAKNSSEQFFIYGTDLLFTWCF